MPASTLGISPSLPLLRPAWRGGSRHGQGVAKGHVLLYNLNGVHPARTTARGRWVHQDPNETPTRSSTPHAAQLADPPPLPSPPRASSTRSP